LEQLVTIELFGQSYTFKTESEATRAKDVGVYLEKAVAEVETQHSGKSSDMTKYTLLILAALNIANENYELRANCSNLMRNISERSKKLIYVLDAGLQPMAIDLVGLK